jgi:hypothetical protein
VLIFQSQFLPEVEEGEENKIKGKLKFERERGGL